MGKNKKSGIAGLFSGLLHPERKTECKPGGNSTSTGDETVLDAGTTLPEPNETAFDSGVTAPELTEDKTTLPTEKSVGSDVYSVGSLLLETYRVESNPILGGMGAVWRVRHTGWDVDLAMKRPKGELFRTEDQKRTFINECDAWIGLGLHPNIVSCYYVRELDDIPTIFSEWMDRGSLRGAMEDGSLYGGSEEEQRARLLDIAIQFARGLRYAHENGLIHQDVKPDNLLLTGEWDAKVADFGIARARAALTVAEGFPTLGEAGGTVLVRSGGYTPAYCSMEQMDGKVISRRTDLYSWAVSVMEMYAGQREWSNGVVAGLGAEGYLEHTRVPVSAALRALLLRCLAAEPEDRPHDFGVVTEELLTIYRGETGREYSRAEPKAAPDTADSLNNRALSYLDLGQPEKAEKLWEQALMLYPAHPESFYNHTLYCLRTDRLTRARAEERMVTRFNFSGSSGKELVGIVRLSLEYRFLEPILEDYISGIRESDPKMGDKLASALADVRRGIPYRCEYTLCVVKDYLHTSQRQVQWEQELQALEAMLASGDLMNAANEMERCRTEYPEFVFTPEGLELHDRMGSRARDFKLTASWILREFPLPENGVCQMLPDGARLLLGREVISLEGDVPPVPCQLPDGPCLVSEPDYTGNRILVWPVGSSEFRLIDLRTGNCLKHYTGHLGRINHACFSTDGRQILSCSEDGTVRLWNTETADITLTLNAGADPILKCGFVWDDRQVVLMRRTAILFVRLPDGQVTQSYHHEPAADFALDFSCNYLVMLCGQGTPTIHAAGKRTDGTWTNLYSLPHELRLFANHGEQIRFHPNMTTAMVCNENGVHFRNVYAMLIGRQDLDDFGSIHSSNVTGFSTDRRGRLVAITTQDSVELWRVMYQKLEVVDKQIPAYLEPCFLAFMARYPHYTPEQVDTILLQEFRDRGYGWLPEDALRDRLRALSRERN